LEKAELDFVTKEILEQHNAVYTDYFRMLTSTQWKVLKSVAKGEELVNPLSKDFISAYNLGAASSVATALKKLTGIELVVYENGKYMIHDVILLRWLQQI